MRKTNKTQRIILEELEKTGLISSACGKAKIPRSTYYRWCSSDIDFRVKAEKAIDAGRANMVDFAESKIIKNIQEGSQRAAEFYLRHNDSRYRSSYAREFQQQVELMKSKYRKEYETIDDIKAALFHALPKEVLLEFARRKSTPLNESVVDFRKMNEVEVKIAAQRIIGSELFYGMVNELMRVEGLTIGDLEKRPPMPEKHEINYDDEDKEDSKDEG